MVHIHASFSLLRSTTSNADLRSSLLTTNNTINTLLRVLRVESYCTLLQSAILDVIVERGTVYTKELVVGLYASTRLLIRIHVSFMLTGFLI